MEHFAIYSPVLGDRRDIPNILINKAFTEDSQNVQLWNGTIRTAKMRAKELLGIDRTIAGLIACWEMNETTSSVVEDSVGVYEGTISDIAAWDTGGYFGGCINCNGTDYITVPDAAGLSFGDGATDGPFSIAAMVYVENNIASQTIISKIDGQSGLYEYVLSLSSSRMIRFYLYKSDGPDNMIFSRASLPIAGDGWHHIAVTYDGSASASGILIYVDSILVPSTRESAGTYVSMSNTAADVIIGGVKDPDGNITDIYQSKIDTVQLYNVELTAAQVSTLYAAKIPTPDGNPIIKYHDHLADSGDLYLLGFTAENVYKWNTTNKTWDVLFAGSTCEAWSVASFNGGVCATNNVDVPKYWDGLAVSMVNLGDPTNGVEVSAGVYLTKARCLTVFENHVLLGNVEVGGESYPNHIYGSDLDECQVDGSTPWIPASSSDAYQGYVPGDGVITGFGLKGDFLYVFKESSVRAFWYTATNTIYNSRAHSARMGCRAPDSVINNSEGKLFFYASDMSFREIDDGEISKTYRTKARNINQGASLQAGIRGHYIQEYDELWWAVPDGSSASGNNKVYVASKIEPGFYGWMTLDMAVTAFGKYRRQDSWTWDTLPFDSWDEFGWSSWDNPESEEGFPIDLCGDANGHTYALHASLKDDGSAFTSYMVMSTDMADTQGLRYFKRLLGIHAIMRNAGTGTITVKVKRDNEYNWQTAGTINAYNAVGDIINEFLPVDHRAQHFLIRLESTVPFEFVGMEFDFQWSGLR